MADFGVLALAAYLPRTRLPHTVVAAAHAWANSGRRHRADTARRVAAYDEDTVTMAVEAGRAALAGTAAEPQSLAIASTTLPFADRSAATLVAEALGLPANLLSQDCGGSLRAATSLLMSRRGGRSLCIASDTRPAKPGSSAELHNGDAAAAILLGDSDSGEGLLARWLGSASVNADLVDHYRAAGAAFDYALEGRWLRQEGYARIAPQAVAMALAEAGIAAPAVDRLLIAGIEPAAVTTVAKAAGLSRIDTADAVGGQVGFTGSAHPYLLLVDALSRCQGGEKIVLCGFGQGCDAIVLEAGAGCASAPQLRGFQNLLDDYRDENSYTRYLTGKGLLQMDWGLRAERDNRTAMTSFYRNRDAVTGFSGGRCQACGTVQFPRSAICVNPECRSRDSQRAFSLRDEAARVKSFTEDWQAYCPVPPLMYGNVQFDCGANVIMEYTDYLPGELATGQALRMVFRIKDVDRQRHFRRYCWKAAACPAARRAH